MKQNYSIVRNGETSVIVTVTTGKSGFYPYQDINTFLEISADLDHETITLKKWHDETEYNYRLLTSTTDPLARWVGLEGAINAIGETLINKAQKEIRVMVKEIKSKLAAARLNPVYQEMAPIADKIRHFRTDFTFHDCLSVMDNKRFLWLVRETGTWLLANKSDFNTCILDQKETHEYYIYNGALKSCDIETARRFYETLPG